MTTDKKSSPATAPLRASPPAKTAKPAAPREPVQFRYLLAQWISERRNDGWYIAKTWQSASGEKPKWEGPFAFPQDASIAIARYLCAELSNRHQSKARFYRVKPTDPLFGLPPLPDLTISAKRGGKS